MNGNDLPIRYEVIYSRPSFVGFCSLPIWIPFNENPMEYARKTLEEIYPHGFKIEHMRIPIKEMISDEQFELNNEHIGRIMKMIGAVS